MGLGKNLNFWRRVPEKIEEKKGAGVEWKKLCRDSGVEPQG